MRMCKVSCCIETRENDESSNKTFCQTGIYEPSPDFIRRLYIRVGDGSCDDWCDRKVRNQ